MNERTMSQSVTASPAHTSPTDGSPTSALSPLAEPDRILSKETCEQLWNRIRGFAKGGGRTAIAIDSFWNGELRWARNRVTLAGDRRNLVITIVRILGNGTGAAVTNQLDDLSLEAAVRESERQARRSQDQRPGEMPLAPPQLPTSLPAIWSDATYTATVETRSALAQTLTKAAEAKGLLSAGYIEVRGAASASAGGWLGDLLREEEYDPALHDTVRYLRMTQGQCSVTVRHAKGLGSGWAGLSSYDWSAIDSAALADQALAKCVASLDPVRIEPGRYTVIMEPQAVCNLVDLISFDRLDPEEFGRGPFVLGRDEGLGLWRTKLGLKVIDERITISHDPMHPLLGVTPQPGLLPVTLVDRGVLTILTNLRGQHALPRLNDNLASLSRPSYQMSGGTTTMEEMIASTKRGLVVTRFSNITKLDYDSVLSTGVTRDGLWLVENGKITKAVKNMRFTESPLFVLNQIEQLGVPVPVFRPERYPKKVQLTPALVPPLKANDFSFTATIDAI